MIIFLIFLFLHVLVFFLGLDVPDELAHAAV